MKFLANLAVSSLFLVCCANAEVRLAGEYLLKAPRDLRILFAMTVTREQDVLSLVPNDDGSLRLSRVRNWLDRQPLEESITLPGLVQGGRAGWAGWGVWSQRISITPDGNFALCVLSGYHKLERQDLVSVVSLASFQVVTTLKTSSVPEVTGESRTYSFGRSGRLVVNAQTSFPCHPGDDAFSGGLRHKLATLALPGMGVTGSCEYSEWIRTATVVRREEVSSCNGLLQEAGFDSLDAFSKSFVETDEVLQRLKGAPPGGCAFLTYESHVSLDGRLRRELCSGGHRGFWGNFVVTGVKENIYSVETGEKLGFIKYPSDHRPESRFAHLGGRDYLLVMEGGTRLRIYQVVANPNPQRPSR